MKNPSDEQLMQRYGQGDMDAFAQLYHKHKGGLYRYIVRQLGDKSLAEDLYQEVWNSVIDAAPSYQPTAQFNTWLYRMARNKLIDQVRHLKVVDGVIDHQSENCDQMAESPHNGIEQLDIQRQAEALKNCLQKLPKAQLDSFLLKEEAGMTGAQVAEVVGASLEATKSRLRVAYQSLRNCIALKVGKVVA